MSVPPQDGWQPNQGPSQYGPPPQPPQPGWQQGPWPPTPPPNNTIKWLLITVAILLVVAVSIGATLLFTRDRGGGSAASNSAVTSDVASANDTGPVAIITDDPTCKALKGINNVLAEVESNGWSAQHASLGTASQWTTDQEAQTQAVATAMTNAADQMVGLAKQTPHRVMRELYEQFIAYGRAYVESIPTYKPADNILADVNVNTANALLGICVAVDNGAANRSLAVAPAGSPTNIAGPGDPANPQRFLTESNSACSAWSANAMSFHVASSEWSQIDTNIPASQWNPDQRATQLAIGPVLTMFAKKMESAGQRSGNSVMEDFAMTASTYFRAYVSVGEGYSRADSWLSYAALRLNNVVSSACEGVSK